MSTGENFGVSPAEMQYVGQVLIERMDKAADSSEDPLEPVSPEVAASIWKQFATDSIEGKPANPVLSQALSKALTYLADEGSSLEVLLGLKPDKGRQPVPLDKKVREAQLVLSLMVEGDSYEEAIAVIAEANNRSESAVEKNYAKMAPYAYAAKAIELLNEPESFSENKKQRFQALYRSKIQRN
jgi:hypothetical protein